jgi:hypothetical protein
MANSYKVFNGPMPTTAALVKVTTGTAVKTMLQVVPAFPIELVEWGWSADASAAATPGQVELLSTGAVAATVTAYAVADVMKYGDPNAPTQTAGTTGVPLNLGTALSGYTASAEGTITAVRELDVQQIAGFNQYCYQFPLGDRPVISAAEVLRIRNTFGAAVNATCYVLFKAAS